MCIRDSPYDVLATIQGSERKEYEGLLKQVMDTPNVEDIRATDTLYLLSLIHISSRWRRRSSPRWAMWGAMWSP